MYKLLYNASIPMSIVGAATPNNRFREDRREALGIATMSTVDR